MDSKTIRADTMLIIGLVGIAAVFLTIISDMILLGRPVSAYSFFNLGTESMAGLEPWRITIGTFLGVFVLPFQIAGLISLYYGLRPSGKIMPLVLFITNAHALMMGVAFHVSYAYIGSGWKLYYQKTVGDKIISELVEKFDFYWTLVIFIMLTEILFSSVVYVRVITKGKTLYPKWMALLNPVCVLAVIFPVILMIPSPVGGYLAPAYLNIGTMLILCFTTVVLYKRLKKDESGNDANSVLAQEVK